MEDSNQPGQKQLSEKSPAVLRLSWVDWYPLIMMCTSPGSSHSQFAFSMRDPSQCTWSTSPLPDKGLGCAHPHSGCKCVFCCLTTSIPIQEGYKEMDSAGFPQQLAASCSGGSTILESMLPKNPKPPNKINPLHSIWMSSHKHKGIKVHLFSFLPIAQACSSWQPHTAHSTLSPHLFLPDTQFTPAVLCLFS